MNTYLTDADVLIDVHRSIYPIGVVPGFWEWFRYKAQLGTILSVDAVRDELLTQELREWTETLPASFFQPILEATDPGKIEVNDWINNHPQYTAAAKRQFAQGADPDLIAYAKQHGLTVITYEVQSPRSRSKIKIPDVCNAIGVKHTTLSRVLAREGARFVLDDAVRQELQTRISQSTSRRN